MRRRNPTFRHVRGRESAFQSLLGHNGGPPLPSAASWNAFCWRKAAARTHKTPSREVLAIRMRRAAELGLDYATYAAILADAGTTPRTLLVVLSRSLIAHGRFGPELADDGSFKMKREAASKLAALSGPGVVLVAPAPAAGPAREAVTTALAITVRAAGWRTTASGILPAGGAGETADWLRGLLSGCGASPRTTLLIADPDAHRYTVTRVRLAGVLAPERYFALPPSASTYQGPH